MKGKMILVAIVVIAMLVLVAWSAVGSEDYYKTETAFGQWQDGITIGYTDGTEKSLKLLIEGGEDWNPFTVTYSGKEISYLTYYLKASVSGTGYDSAIFNTESLLVKNYRDDVYEYDYQEKGYYDAKEIAVGDDSVIHTFTVYADDLDLLPDGSYLIKWECSGSITYYGYPGGEDFIETATLPGYREVAVTVSHDAPGQLIVNIDSNVYGWG